MMTPAPSTLETPCDEPRAAVRYRTVFLDGQALGAALAARAHRQAGTSPPSTPERLVTTVDAELAPVRKNVQDAARAVLTWLAAVVSHEADTDLDAILDACLRPGPDTGSVNFNALTEQINTTLGTDLTPKRVRTAVRHLRKARDQKTTGCGPSRCLTDDAAALSGRLMAHRADLRPGPGDGDRHAVTLEVLGAVRAAAGRLIDHDFAEGLSAESDLRHGWTLPEPMRGGATGAQASEPDVIGRFQKTLRDCDGDPEADMRLVLDGAQVVAALAGRGSWPGVLARLNVWVVGRCLIDSQAYLDGLIRLADEAEALAGDPVSNAWRRAARGLPEDRCLPGPLRVMSYALNNAATHALERLFTGQRQDVACLALAERCIERIARRDRGFPLLATTRLIVALTLSRIRHDESIALDFWASRGEARALELLEALARFDNSDELNRTAEHYAVRALPGLRRRLIRVG